MPVSAGPNQPRRDPGAAKSAALVALRQAIWEASQFEPLSAIQDYCLEILDEIESDEP